MKLISVIIPIYNTQKYLKKCIDSVESQSYNNIEIILYTTGIMLFPLFLNIPVKDSITHPVFTQAIIQKNK